MRLNQGDWLLRKSARISAHTTLPPTPRGKYQFHRVLKVSTSSNPRPPSAASLAWTSTGGCVLPSHTSTRTRDLSDDSRSRIGERTGPFIASVVLSPFVTSSDTISSAVSP